MLGLSFRNLPASRETSERRYRKYYERNPLGSPSFFLARERDSEGFCGMAALFPARLWVSGEAVSAGINGDLAVDARHRAFGPAIALERAVLSALSEDGRLCAYGRPNPMAELIVDRVGFADLGRVARFVKVLRIRPLAEAHVRRRALARIVSGASFVLDPILSVLSRERLRRRSRELSVERPDRFDERFSALWEAARDEHGVTSVRDVDVLNWRYELDEGGAGFEIFALVGSDGQVAAYLVYRVRDGIRHVFDVLFGASKTVLDTLLSEFILDARHAGAAAISVDYLGSPHLLTSRMRTFGFIRRSRPDGLRVRVDAAVSQSERLLDSRSWFLLAGDTDL